MTTPHSKETLVLFVRTPYGNKEAHNTLAQAATTGVLNGRKITIFQIEEGTSAKNFGDFGVVLKSPMDEIGVHDLLFRRERLIVEAAKLMPFTLPTRDTKSLAKRAAPSSLNFELAAK